MEGIGFLYILLIFLFFIAFLFSTLLILHFLKIQPATSTVILVGVLALVLSIIIIRTNIMLDISFGALLIYTVCVFTGYLFFAGFSGQKHLPRKEGKS